MLLGSLGVCVTRLVVATVHRSRDEGVSQSNTEGTEKNTNERCGLKEERAMIQHPEDSKLPCPGGWRWIGLVREGVVEKDI